MTKNRAAPWRNKILFPNKRNKKISICFFVELLFLTTLLTATAPRVLASFALADDTVGQGLYKWVRQKLSHPVCMYSYYTYLPSFLSKIVIFLSSNIGLERIWKFRTSSNFSKLGISNIKANEPVGSCFKIELTLKLRISHKTERNTQMVYFSFSKTPFLHNLWKN